MTQLKLGGADAWRAGAARRQRLENTVSVAGVLLLTEATMTEIPEPAVQPANPVEV